MAGPSGIRWPDDLKDEIERAMVEDDRSTFTNEVIFLVRLGLDERAWRRQVVAEALSKRRGGGGSAAAG